MWNCKSPGILIATKNQEKSMPVLDNNSESNMISETLSNESAAIATQLSKSITDRVDKGSNVIAYNLK